MFNRACRRVAWAFLALAWVSDPAPAAPPAAECPQPRFTGRAPDDYYSRKNPLEANPDVLAAGQKLYLGQAGNAGCAVCHGDTGQGNGYLAGQFNPRPRNFACAATVNDIPDGQLFWIIRFGSPGAAMPSHKGLSDEQVWQLVHYLRRLAN